MQVDGAFMVALTNEAAEILEAIAEAVRLSIGLGRKTDREHFAAHWATSFLRRF